MGPWSVILSLVSASAVAAEGSGLEHEININFEKFAGGYVPGAVVRPKGDTQVKDIPNAESVVEMDMRLRLGAFSVGFRPFMLDAPGHSGPAVVGSAYDLLITPIRCQDSQKVSFDAPWRRPCVALGFSHRSEHNADDGTYGSTYVNSLAVRLRLLAGDGGKTNLWLIGQYAPDSLESPFAITRFTDIVADEMEKRVWSLGSSWGVLFGESGSFTGTAELRAGEHGPAAAGALLRYRHFFLVKLADDGQKDGLLSGMAAMKLYIGAELGAELNLRKTEQMGQTAIRFGLVAGLPIGN